MPERPRTLTELRALRRGALAILADKHPDVAGYLEIVDESLTRLEDANPLHRASASFRQATAELTHASEAVTKPIPPLEQQELRRTATPGYGVQPGKTTERGLGKKDHDR
jgi:hypothetical protein